MKLYVVRHGETNANKNYIIAGRTDVDINELGIQQAKEAGEIMKNKEYDQVFCSPLLRTRHTCEYVNCQKIEVQLDDRIQERYAGIYECTISYPKDPEGLHIEEYWNYHINKAYSKAETLDELYVRVKEFLEILQKKYSDSNILIVTHDGVCRTIRWILEGLPKSGNIREYSQKNCEIREYELG